MFEIFRNSWTVPFYLLEDYNNKRYIIIYVYFPDSRGNLCQDRMELVQDTEYETMIQCRVAMTKSCEDNTIDDTITKSEEACHTVYEKECETVYRPHRSKVRHN